MPLLKTCEPHPESIDSVSSKPMSKRITTGKKTFRTITMEHILTGLTTHLRALSMIDDNEEVTMFGFNAMERTYEIKVEKIHD